MKESSNPITFGFPTSLRYNTQPINKIPYNTTILPMYTHHTIVWDLITTTYRKSNINQPLYISINKINPYKWHWSCASVYSHLSTLLSQHNYTITCTLSGNCNFLLFWPLPNTNSSTSHTSTSHSISKKVFVQHKFSLFIIFLIWLNLTTVA